MTKRKQDKPWVIATILMFVVIRSNAGFSPDVTSGLLVSFPYWKNSVMFGYDKASIHAGIRPFLNTPEIPLHPSMENFITDYHEKNMGLFEKLKQKNGYNFKTIDKIFTQYGIPVELKYLAVVESKLRSNAVSKVGATGMWQFMPATAKKLGLTISDKTDDRKNTWKSSVAAARYLEKLYGMFNDWLLALAAYNSGPGVIYAAIKKSGSRNFWKLQYFLPRETRVHVKKFIATHYYFEGGGSMVTMGKKESEEYMKATDDFLTEENKSKNLIPITVPAKNTTRITRWIAIVNDEKKLSLFLRK